MRRILNGFVSLFVVGALVATLFYYGGPVLLAVLGFLAALAVLVFVYKLGQRDAHRLMTEGAKLVIQASNNNDRNDAAKIQALSLLTREAIKATGKNQAQASSGYPVLPSFTEGDFTIAGLDEEIEQ